MKRREGFTLIEVMVSLGVMTIGAMAIISMQQQTTRANVHAREISTGMQIAQTWIERLKLDGTRWTTVTNSAADLAATTFLGINGGAGTPSAQFATIPIAALAPAAGLYDPSASADTPPNFMTGISNGFDYYGNDVSTADMAQVHFCASYRLTWVFRTTGGATPGSDDRALRADVRVWWAKEITTNAAKTNANRLAQDFPLCADDHVRLSPGVTGTEFNNYHIVYLSTVLRPMP